MIDNQGYMNYIHSTENYGNPNSLGASIPDSLTYTLPQGIGIPKRLKYMRYYPSGTNSRDVGSNDIVRFNIHGEQFWDPYSCFLRVTIEVPNEVLADPAVKWDGTNFNDSKIMQSKALQLDNSAHSLLQFMTWSEQGIELERIMHYDVIANCLKDASYGRTARTTKDHEGLGGQVGSNFTSQVMFSSQAPVFIYPYPTDADPAVQLASKLAQWPNRNFDVPRVDLTDPANPVLQAPAGTNKYRMHNPGGINTPTLAQPFGVTIGNPNRTFSMKETLFYDPTRNYNYFNPGSGLGGAFDIIAGTIAIDEEDVTGGYSSLLHPVEWSYKPLPVLHMLYDCPNLGFQTMYGDGFIDTRTNTQVGAGTWDSKIDNIPGGARPAPFPDGYNHPIVARHYPTDLLPDTSTITGNFSNPFPANFGTTTLEPIFSGEPQFVIYNGVPSVQQVTKMTFHIPLMSGIFGALMAPNNYKLIPLVAFKNLMLEIQFNPYALFTSFSSSAYQDRRYVVKAVELDVQLAEFMDLNVIRATNEAIRSGFTLTTQSYYMGPIYNVTDNNIPPTLQINLGFDSLRAIFLVMLAGDYLNNTMYRKHYRLSGNLTSLQLKIGTEYYPGQPIRGNAGNNWGEDNNYEFYMNTLKAFRKLQTTEELAINPHNMAINWRELTIAQIIGKDRQNINPGVTEPQIGAAPLNFKTGAETFQGTHAQAVNGMQLGYFYENRVVGKAIFGISLDAMNYENTILSGIRTTDAKPFEMLLTYANTSTTEFGYKSNMTMYVFCEYDLILSFNNGEVRALGKS